MAHAIRSINLIRHQIPLNARTLFLKITWAFTLIVFGYLFSKVICKNLKRLIRQINRGIKVCFLRKNYDIPRDLLIQTKNLPAELIIAKMSLIKFHYDIDRPENSESFYGYLGLHPNTRTKKFKILQNLKTIFGTISVVR